MKTVFWIGVAAIVILYFLGLKTQALEPPVTPEKKTEKPSILATIGAGIKGILSAGVLAGLSAKATAGAGAGATASGSVAGAGHTLAYTVGNIATSVAFVGVFLFGLIGFLGGKAISKEEQAALDAKYKAAVDLATKAYRAKGATQQDIRELQRIWSKEV
jgi:hypothetical protein